MQQGPQKTNSTNSFIATASSNGTVGTISSRPAPFINGALSNGCVSGLGLTSALTSQALVQAAAAAISSSISSIGGNSSTLDDKSYTQNALQQIRNSLQPFATKSVPNGLDFRPSSASSNASSSNSNNSIMKPLDYHQQQQRLMNSHPHSHISSNNYMYMSPPCHQAGTRLSTSSSTKINLGSTTGNNTVSSNNCDTNVNFTPSTVEQTKQLMKQLLENGLPEVIVLYKILKYSI